MLRQWGLVHCQPTLLQQRTMSAYQPHTQGQQLCRSEQAQQLCPKSITPLSMLNCKTLSKPGLGRHSAAGLTLQPCAAT